MDSVALTTYLNAEWAEVIAEASIDVSRIVGIVAEVYSADSTIDDAWAESLGDYYLLRRAVRVFSVDFDVSISGDSYRLSQRKQLQTLLVDAEAKIAHLVRPEAATVSTWDLNFLTDEETSA